MNLPLIQTLRVRDTLLCVFPKELGDAAVEDYPLQLLERIERTRCCKVLLDVSAMEVVDTYVAAVLARTVNNARLLGSRTVLCGIRPEVAATLAHMGQTLPGVQTALNVDRGFALLNAPGAIP